MSFSRGARPPRAHATAAALVAASMFSAASAVALDKQGSAHGGDIEGPTSGFDVSGSVALGISPYNPNYAARPDNTGRALMRYALHTDVDLIGHRLSIPVDLNVFSDRQRPGLLKLAPSEFDVIAGVTSTWSAGPGAIEFGLRGESDRARRSGHPGPELSIDFSDAILVLTCGVHRRTGSRARRRGHQFLGRARRFRHQSHVRRASR